MKEKPQFSVVCFKWKPHAQYRSQFTTRHVNVLRNMVRRNFAWPHRFICVTDDPEGLDKGIEYVPLWKDFSDLINPYGKLNPSCYRRLKVFSREIEDVFGPRFVCIDLDTVITSDVRCLWLRREDFMIWGDTNPTTLYNGSMMLMTAGVRAKVWESFDPATSPVITRKKGFFGSDQAWISYCLGPGEARWTRRDGVFSFRNEIGPHRTAPPPGTRIVFFHGQIDPWSPEARNLPWVAEHYR